MPALLRLFSSLNQTSTCSDEKDTYCLPALGVYLSFGSDRWRSSISFGTYRFKILE